MTHAPKNRINCMIDNVSACELLIYYNAFQYNMGNTMKILTFSIIFGSKQSEVCIWLFQYFSICLYDVDQKTYFKLKISFMFSHILFWIQLNYESNFLKMHVFFLITKKIWKENFGKTIIFTQRQSFCQNRV